MPIKFTIDHDKRQVEAVCDGDVALKDIEDFLDAIVVQSAIPYRKLFDGRRAIPVYTDINEDLMLLAARISAYAAHMDKRGALALIAGDPKSQELAARFLNLGKPASRPGRAFIDEREARRWLAEQPEVPASEVSPPPETPAAGAGANEADRPSPGRPRPADRQR